MGLSCSARVRRLKGILRRAHVTIFIVDYEDFQSQLSGFSRIFEDFDWAPLIFTQDVRRKTYWILLWKYFFPKNLKSVTVVARRIEFQLQPPWLNFRKLSQFSIDSKLPDLTDVQVVLTGTVSIKSFFFLIRNSLSHTVYWYSVRELKFSTKFSMRESGDGQGPDRHRISRSSEDPCMVLVTYYLTVTGFSDNPFSQRIR